MSTPCLIATATDVGFASIYCHHDGYPEAAGATLLAHYGEADASARAALLALGNISVLGPTLATCDAYGRDWGRRGERPRSHAAFDQLVACAHRDQVDWVYVWVDAIWLHARVRYGAPLPLADLVPIPVAREIPTGST